MITIWKFPVEIKDEQEIEMPEGVRILSAGIQNNCICIWAIVSDLQKKRKENHCYNRDRNPLLVRFLGLYRKRSTRIFCMAYLFETKGDR